MIKKAPTFAQIAAMAGFVLSVVGLLMLLWIQFGGSIPLRAEQYRFQASFDEAALLVEQADVRMAGIDVGKVVDKKLEDGRTLATIELEEPYAPIPRNTRVLLRTKALLGETYVELTPGDRGAARSTTATRCRPPRPRRPCRSTRSCGPSTSRPATRSGAGCTSWRARSAEAAART